MVEKRQKYILKSQYKDKLLVVVSDILNNTMDPYHLIPLQGLKGYFRIRVGDLRIVYKITSIGNRIKYIGPRGDAYKI